MTDSYRMSDMCAMCGERYGQHVGLSCCNSRGSFVLAAEPAAMTDSYHFQIEPEPRAEGAKFDGYFLCAETSQLFFPSGAALQLAGDKIVGRVEASPATYDVSVGNRLLTSDELLAGLREVLDALRAQDALPKPERDPLDWNTATLFDTFGPDFIVTKGEVPTAPLHTSPTTDSAYPAIAGLLRG